MSRIFQQKNKDLVNLEVISADKVWNKIISFDPYF